MALGPFADLNKEIHVDTSMKLLIVQKLLILHAITWYNSLISGRLNSMKVYHS